MTKANVFIRHTIFKLLRLHILYFSLKGEKKTGKRIKKFRKSPRLNHDLNGCKRKRMRRRSRERHSQDLLKIPFGSEGNFLVPMNTNVFRDR